MQNEPETRRDSTGRAFLRWSTGALVIALTTMIVLSTIGALLFFIGSAPVRVFD